MAENPIYRIIKDQTRREIITFLGEKEKATYTDIISHLNISTGKLNYHLRFLSGMIEKVDGGYVLNENGEKLYEILKDNPENRKQDYGIPYRNVFRPVGWLMLALFSVSLYFAVVDPLIAVQFASLALLILSVFFFYYSGNREFTIPELIALIAISAVVGGLSFFINYSVAYSQVPSYYPVLRFPYAIMAIIFFGTFLYWGNTDFRRTSMTAVVILIPGILSIVGMLSAGNSLSTGELTLGTAIFPAIFLPVTLGMYIMNGRIAKMTSGTMKS